MKIIQCPEELSDGTDYWIFLAGGISGCSDWQSEMIESLKNITQHEICASELVLINPRRVNFDILDTAMASEQIRWEHHYLMMSDAVSFWFPKETLCPITLYELGMCAAMGKKLYVGCDLDYKRNFDVKEQLQLLCPEVHVHDSLDEVIEEIVGDLRTYENNRQTL